MITEKSIKISPQEKRIPKKRLLIVSDTHISKVQGAFNLHAFNVGMEQINNVKNVALNLHLGDVTHLGTLLDYEFALEQFKKFDPISKSPIMILIGNHDALNVGYLLFEEMIGRRHYEYEDKDIYVIGIDSTNPDLAGGIIHHNVIETVKNELEKREREDKFKVVCFHHQLIPIPNTGKERSAIDDSGDMLKMLLDAKADLVLNGHRHISNLYTVSSSEKDLYVFNAGTFSCNKTRYRELFTYAVIDIVGNRIKFQVVPVLDSNSKREILREVNYYVPLKLDKHMKPIARFIQFSNSLISGKDFENQTTSLDKAIKEVNLINDIDLVVHTGNVSKNSFKEEFQIAKDKIKQISHPYIVVPGYTDSRPPAWEHWLHFFGDLDPLYENDKIYFQGINSTTRDSKQGRIGRKKLNSFIDNVLSLSHQKIFGVCCFHSLIPTPLSVWRTELIDSGDVLSQFARSQIDLVLNSSPSTSFNVKIENTVFSNGGNLEGTYFDPCFLEIEIYQKGLIVLKEHNLRTGEVKVIGNYYITVLI